MLLAVYRQANFLGGIIVESPLLREKREEIRALKSGPLKV